MSIFNGFANAGVGINRALWEGTIRSNQHHFWLFMSDWDKTLYHFCQMGIMPQVMLVCFFSSPALA